MFYRFSAEEKCLRDSLFAAVSRQQRDEYLAILDRLTSCSTILEELMEKCIRDNNAQLLHEVLLRVDDINKKRFFWGRTAANFAAETDKPDCLAKLVEFDADLNVEDNDGDTVILKICGKNGNASTLNSTLAFAPASDNRIPIIGFLDFISCGCDVNHCNKKGQNAAIIAVLNDNVHLIRPLCSGGVNLNVFDHEGNAAIHYAVMRSRPECVQILIECGADCNLTQNKSGDTPAHLAILTPGSDFSYSCLTTLVKSGANLELVNCNSSSALMFDVAHPISAKNLAEVQAARGYPHALEVIQETEVLTPDASKRTVNVLEYGIEGITAAASISVNFIRDASISTASVVYTVAETSSTIISPITHLTSGPEVASS